MSWKDEFIAKYSEEAYKKRAAEKSRQWRKAYPEKAKEYNHELSRKEGKYYLKALKYDHTGLRGERGRIRRNHQYMWRQYKNVIAPKSQLHHQWIPGSAQYAGVALVEKDQHMHGRIKVIKILDGEITVFSEKELQGGLAI